MPLIGEGTGDGGASLGSWVRDNTDKLLLIFLLLVLLSYNIYIVNKTTDNQVQFINGLINTALGAFINQVTGSIANKAKATASAGGQTLKLEQEGDKK